MSVFKNIKGKSTSFSHNEDVFLVDKKLCKTIICFSYADKMNKSRLNLHQERREKVQEMIIAINKKNNTKPHVHIDKTESFQVLEGEMMMFIFNEKGKVLQKVKMGNYESGLPFICRIQPNIWHCNKALTKEVLFYEVIEGPFL
jgi:glucose-6-phosphate isomerase